MSKNDVKPRGNDRFPNGPKFTSADPSGKLTWAELEAKRLADIEKKKRR